jgi:hypothetical protein
MPTTAAGGCYPANSRGAAESLVCEAEAERRASAASEGVVRGKRIAPKKSQFWTRGEFAPGKAPGSGGGGGPAVRNGK